MTEQPPGPPTGNYPPPPPTPPGGFPPPPSSSGGYPSPPAPPATGYPAPPPAAGGYAPPAPGQGSPALPQTAYTPWITRVLAFILDYIPYAIIVGIGAGLLAGTRECIDFSDTGIGDVMGQSYGSAKVCGASTLGQTSLAVSVLVALAFVIWNYGYRQGKTGSSIGKSIMKFKVVSEKTGEPIGFGMSIVRQIAHVADSIICGIGYLFPLWDGKRQTFADKIMTTVCLPL
jgi:uncharacterized RDD family membrane protein YckC